MKKIIKNQNGGSAPTGTQSWFQTYGGNIASNLLDKFPNSGQFFNGNNFEMGKLRGGISNALLSSGNPYAMAAGLLYGIGNKVGVFSDTSQGLGTWNDLGNAALSLIPGLKYILPKTDKLQISKEAQALGDQAYRGSIHEMRTTQQNSGLNIGFGINEQRNRANKFENQNKKFETIGTGALNDSWAVASNAQNMAKENVYRKMGGYKKTSLYGKLGMKIERAKQISSQIKDEKNVFKPTSAEDDKVFFDSLTFDETPIFQEGGKSPSAPKLNSVESGESPIGFSESGIPLYLKGDGTIGPVENIGENNLFDLIKNSNANFAKRLQDPNRKFIKLENGEWGNFKLAWSEDETGVIVYPEIQEIDGKLIDLSNDPDKAWELAIKHKDYVYFPSREAAEWFTTHYKDYYKGFQTEPQTSKEPQQFKEGGQMNVIPEGSLHARLHHMEGADNLTKKGIPVVDNEGNQQAEVERAEIIFNKEVTDKLEELLKKFSSDEYTAKEKDDFAIEAGKLLSTQIIENTDDRAGLINKVENEQIQSNN